jgi:outer membrane protein W
MTQNKGHIFGNITSVDEHQDYLPYKPTIQLNFFKNWALEFTYDRFKATTTNSYVVPGSHDGDLVWTPFMLGLQFRWPLYKKTLVPYLTGGVSYNKVEFNENPWYKWGFGSPEDYEEWTSQGRKPEDYPNNGYRRDFRPEDSWGTYLGLGIDYFFTPHWALNLDWRYHWARTNFRYILAYGEGADVTVDTRGTFNLEQWIIGLGIKYFF